MKNENKVIQAIERAINARQSIATHMREALLDYREIFVMDKQDVDYLDRINYGFYDEGWNLESDESAKRIEDMYAKYFSKVEI